MEKEQKRRILPAQSNIFIPEFAMGLLEYKENNLLMQLASGELSKTSFCIDEVILFKFYLKRTFAEIRNRFY